MKFLLGLVWCLCVDLILSTPTSNRMPNKYKNNPFLTQRGHRSLKKYESNPFFNSPAPAPTLSRQELAIKYAHNPFLSQLFPKNPSMPAINKPVLAINKPVLSSNNRLETMSNHRNINLLPSRGSCGIQETTDRIALGHEAALGQFPWMVLLEYKIKKISIGYQCGGILINDRYILTAAHCVKAKSMSAGEKLFKVRLGEHNIYTIKDCDHQNDCNDPPVDVIIDEIIMHPDYDVGNKNFYHDIALLRMRQKISMTHFIKPICLPLNGEKTRPGVHMHIAGWGIRDDDDSLSKVKMTADIPYINDIQCKKLWKTNIDIIDSQFCAGGTSRTNACKGDSGGPIMTTFRNSDQWYAEGIVSFGNSECGGDPFPTVYTRVSSYINWILDNLKE